MRDLLLEKMDELINDQSSSNIQSLVESGELIPIEEGVYYDIINEKAKFSLAPKFKDDPGTKDLFKVAEEAESFLNSNGIETKADAEKGWNIVFKVLKIAGNIGSFAGIGLNIVRMPAAMAAVASVPGAATGVAIGTLIGTIIGYLIRRLIEWAYRAGQGSMAKSNARKTITQLERMKKNCTDNKSKDRIDGYIDKINDMLDKYEKN